MNLTILAEISQILGGISVVVAVLFGITQTRQFKQQRRDAAAVELMRTIEDSEFARAFRIIYPLPESLSPAEFFAMGLEVQDAAFIIGAKFETMGLLSFRHIIPLDLVEELIGGAVIAFWKSMRPWIEHQRMQRGEARLLEWFQWLAERLEERARSGQAPAYELYRDWRV